MFPLTRFFFCRRGWACLLRPEVERDRVLSTEARLLVANLSDFRRRHVVFIEVPASTAIRCHFLGSSMKCVRRVLAAESNSEQEFDRKCHFVLEDSVRHEDGSHPAKMGVFLDAVSLKLNSLGAKNVFGADAIDN